MRGKAFFPRTISAVGVWMLICISTAMSQDTLRISLNDAEEKMITGSLALIAQRYGIDAGKALELQAGLWDNPNLNITQNIHNQFTGKWFDVTSSGNTDVQITQLFKLAGQRDEAVQLARMDGRLTENEYYKTVRDLKFALRNDFYNLYYLYKSLDFYNRSINSVGSTAEIAKKMNKQGTIILSDVIRLKALLFTLDNERNDILSRIHEAESDLHILMGDTSSIRKIIIPDLPDNIIYEKFPDLSISEIYTNALKSRPEIKETDTQIDWEKANFNLQKSLAVPDLSIGFSYSRNGGYIPDYTGISFGIDLPLFNRNQGNIAYAEARIKGAETLRENEKVEIMNDIICAYQKASESDSLYEKYKSDFTLDYDNLAENVTNNFRSRNITLIEYTDFFESYRTAMLQINELASKRLDAFEALNFAAGYDLIKY